MRLWRGRLGRLGICEGAAVVCRETSSVPAAVMPRWRVLSPRTVAGRCEIWPA